MSNLSSLQNIYNQAEAHEKEAIFEKFEKVISHLSSTLNELVEALIIKEKVNDDLSEISLIEIFEKTSETLTGQILDTKAALTTDFAAFETIEYNKGYMESIMLNLISNAIKYRSPARAPEIRVYTRNGSGCRELHIQDNGLGIDLRRYGRKIFGLHKTFHHHPDAKGVGLFLVKTQVEAMGGHIQVESEPGLGTRFIISMTTSKGS